MAVRRVQAQQETAGSSTEPARLTLSTSDSRTGSMSRREHVRVELPSDGMANFLMYWLIGRVV